MELVLIDLVSPTGLFAVNTAESVASQKLILALFLGTSVLSTSTSSGNCACNIIFVTTCALRI